MKQWRPSDWIAIGLLGLIYIYLIFVFILMLTGKDKLDNDAGVRTKEIIIYILGVLSGYIGIKKVKQNGN